MWRIGVCLDVGQAPQKRLMAGIRQYAGWTGKVQFMLAHHNPHRVGILRRWKPDGLITQFSDLKGERSSLVGATPHLVNATSFGADHGIHVVALDPQAIARVCRDHLLGVRVRHLGYFGWDRVRMGEELCAVAAERGVGCSVFAMNLEWPHPPGESVYVTQFDQVREWLRQLPKPVGVIGGTDYEAMELVHMAADLGLAVPQDVAIMGIGDDPEMCMMTAPTISSVQLPMERVGYESARRLHEFLEKRRTDATPLLLPPVGIEQRESTNTVAPFDDPVVRRAVLLIREQATTGLTVQDVLDAVQVSQSTLTQKLRKALGRSTMEEIRRVQLERARSLLMETDWPVGRVATASGFTGVEHLCVVFRRDCGCTPMEFRRANTRRT